MRYSSPVMEEIFGDASRYSEWRRLWTVLAEIQASMGRSIPESTIKALRANCDNIDWARVAELESEVHHDVVAHRLAFEEVVPEARGLLHWGVTSSWVTDTADALLQRRGLDALQDSLSGVLSVLEWFSQRWMDRAVVGRTHLQPGSRITLGLRSSRWAWNFVEARALVDFVRSRIRFPGVRGPVGTAAVVVEHFGELGSIEMERKVAEALGFDSIFPVVSQTTPRLVELGVFSAVESLSSAAAVLAQDIRLMAAFGEFEEPFGESQYGSSVMPTKRNPILSERIVSLNRRIRSSRAALSETVVVQGLERTLDDSAIRRLTIPEGFHLTDYSLGLVRRIIGEGRVMVGGIEFELERNRAAWMAESELSRVSGEGREMEYRRLQSGGEATGVDPGLGRAASMVGDCWSCTGVVW